MKPKVIFVASLAESLLNFRLHLMQQFIAEGYEVVACAPKDAATAQVLSTLSIRFVELPLVRNGLNPFKDIKLLWKIYSLLKKERPQLVFSYTIKPVVFGSIAARFAAIPNIYSMITGTGYIFSKDTLKSKIVGIIGKNLFKFALKFNKTIIFQNKDNLAFFKSQGLISNGQPTAVVNGSGVDINHYSVTALPLNTTFLMIARFLHDKGIKEYVAAARRIKAIYPDVTCLLVGWIDTNPNSISESELQSWISEGVIHYLGKLSDVRPAIAAASIYVLPSYAEGTPRTVLEAMAMGRPIITTDAPGCRETVIPDKTGFLVPVKDVDALFKAMQYFHENPFAIKTMGTASRQLAEEKYDVRKVNNTMLDAMNITPLEKVNLGENLCQH